MTEDRKRQRPGEVALVIQRFPKKVRRRIKMAAVASGRWMHDIIAEACEEWLKKRGK